MYRTGRTMGQRHHQISKKWWWHSSQQHLPQYKNHLTTWANGSAPIRSHCLHQHWTLHWLVNRTGATMGQKTSNQQKVMATQDTTALTSPQKIAFQHELPDLGQSQATAFIRIECHIDWWVTLIDVSYRRDNGWEDIKSTKSDGDTGYKSTYLCTKNCLSTKAARSTPVPSYCLHQHQMPHQLIYHTGRTMGEKTLNQQKWRQHRTQQHLPQYKKLLSDTSCRIHTNPKLFPSLALNAASIDVSYRRNVGWEDIESTKSIGDTSRQTYPPLYKKHLATQTAGSTPFRCYFGNPPHPIPYQLMYRTHIEIDSLPIEKIGLLH